MMASMSLSVVPSVNKIDLDPVILSMPTVLLMVPLESRLMMWSFMTGMLCVGGGAGNKFHAGSIFGNDLCMDLLIALERMEFFKAGDTCSKVSAIPMSFRVAK